MASRKNNPVPFNAADVANAAKANPYVQRLVEDQDLRQNIQKAFGSGKNAYARASGNGSSARDVLADDKFYAEVLAGIEALRDVTLALTEPPDTRARKGLRLGRRLMVLMLAFGLALSASEQLRSKVLDTLFGKEEQFEYTPPATPSSTPPASPVSAA